MTLCCKFTILTCNKKGEIREISLEDDEPLVIKEMLRYLYTGQYNDDDGGTPEPPLPSLLFNVHLHIMGDKYDIPDLCKVAEERFAATAGDKWYTTDFANAIAEIYKTAPDTKGVLHKTAIEVASKNAKQLFTRTDCERFREVTAETAAFMSELFGILITQGYTREDEARYECRDCQRTMVILKMNLEVSYRCPYPGCPSRAIPYSKLGREWRPR